MVCAGLGFCLASCGDLPQREVGFDSPDPAGRVEALRRAAAAGDPASIPGLIGLLDSADSAERMYASVALTRLTGQDFGYSHADPEAARQAAAARWQAWWEATQRGEAGARSDRYSSPVAHVEERGAR